MPVFLRELIQSTSFSVQMTVALFLAFSGKKLRQRGWLPLLFCIAEAILIPFLWDRFFGLEFKLLTAFRYLAVFLFLEIGMFYAFDCSLLEVVFFSIAAYTMQHLSTSCSWLIALGFFSSFVTGDFLRIQIFNDLSCVAIYTISYFTVLRRIKTRKVNLEALRLIIPSAIILLTSVILFLLLLRLRYEYPVVEIYHIALCILALFLQASLFHNSQLVEEKEYINYMLQMSGMHSELSKASINAINAKCHDMKKQLETIKKLTSTDELNEYKTEIERSIADYEVVANTGNEAINVAITERSLLCQRKGIKFTYVVDGTLLSFMNSPDLYSLFGNALDNAIEAVLELEEDRRVITLNVRREKDMLCIRTENYFKGKIELKDGLPKTIKQDHTQHGFGLKSIKMIAEKYGGSATVLVEDDVFILNLLFTSK